MLPPSLRSVRACQLGCLSAGRQRQLGCLPPRRPRDHVCPVLGTALHCPARGPHAATFAALNRLTTLTTLPARSAGSQEGEASVGALFSISLSSVPVRCPFGTCHAHSLSHSPPAIHHELLIWLFTVDRACLFPGLTTVRAKEI